MNLKPVRAGLSGIILFSILALVLSSNGVIAQGAATGTPTETPTPLPACPDFVMNAVQNINQECANLGRNQVCYGNTAIKAEPQQGIGDFTFNAPGDIVDVAKVHMLQLSALNADDKTWGVALLKIQANLPDTVAGQNVTALLYGDVEIENAAQGASFPVTVSDKTPVRGKPQNGSGVITQLVAKDTVTADGETADKTWLRVEVPTKDGKSRLGWLQVAQVTASGDVSTLPVIDPNAPVYGPMQAFYFRSGVGSQACKEIPHSGLLIQTSKGAPRATLRINDVTLTVGSTVYLEANAGHDMDIYTLEGLVGVTAGGKTQLIPAGKAAGIPIDDHLKASGAPEVPQPYDAASVQGLPLQGLPRLITPVPPPPTPAPGHTTTAGGVCPAGAPQQYTVDGVTHTLPCSCANGFHVVSETSEGHTMTAQICN